MTHLEAFRHKLSGKADAALISSPQNQYYLSHFPYEDGYLLILSDAAYLLADFRYAEAAKQQADRDFTVVERKGLNMMSEILALLQYHNAKTLLLEEQNVTLATHARIAGTLTGIELCTGAGALLSELRMRKDAEEIAIIGEAQEITDAAFTHILTYLHEGLREIDVALELETFMRRQGADGISFDTIAVSGSASSLPHGVPRACTLEKGFLTMDFGARYRGYCADMTRTVVIGRADDDMKHLYNTVLSAQRAALAAAKSGMSCNALDKVARDIIYDAGYQGCFGHSLGHGVGIDVHETPSVSPSSKPESLLLPGHIVTVEPGIYIEGKYGCRIEDMIAVLPDGKIHNFTKSDKELIEI